MINKLSSTAVHVQCVGALDLKLTALSTVDGAQSDNQGVVNPPVKTTVYFVFFLKYSWLNSGFYSLSVSAVCRQINRKHDIPGRFNRNQGIYV